MPPLVSPTALRFRRNNGRLHSIAQRNVHGVRLPHTLIFEADALDVDPLEGLIPTLFKLTQYADPNFRVVELDGQQLL